MATIDSSHLSQQEVTLSAEFGLLRERVDRLDLKTAEIAKPWYRQLPLWISILSLLISSGFSAYTAFRQSEDKQSEELKSRLETLRTTVLQIIDIRKEFLQASATSDQDVAQFTQKSSLLNTKKQVLVENADALLAGIEKQVSAAVFIDLAYEEASDGRLAEAERYYRLGLQSKHLDTLSAVALCRSLGELYLQPRTPLYKPDQGREYFRQALDTLRDQEDDHSVYNRAYVLSDWSYLESANKNSDVAKKLLDGARIEALKIGEGNPLRQQAVNLVLTAEQFSSSLSKAKASASPGRVSGFIGRWRVKYGGEPAMSGSVTIVSADPKTTSATMNVFQGEKLLKRYSGQIYVLDSGEIQIEWTGVESKSGMGIPWIYINGLTSLHKSSDDVMRGNEYTLGDATRAVEFRRL